MLAIEITSSGDPSVLQPVELPVPEPAPAEVLIRVDASGVARADTLQRRGKYPPPQGASDIPGLDVAGIVESCGSQVKSRLRPGDRICAILAGGGYAEYVAVPYQQVLRIPDNWTATEAATLPENMFTAFDALVLRAGLQAGESALIHGGSSGVGSMAIMLCKALGVTAYATAGTDEKCAACVSFGAAAAVNYRTADFADKIATLTKGRGVNVVLDMVGGSYWQANMRSLAPKGRLVIIATQGGRQADVNLGELLSKRISVFGSSMRSRTPDEKGVVAQALMEKIWPLLPAKNPIRPVIDRVFPLFAAAEAHWRMEEGNHIGKIVLVAARQ